MRFLNLYLFVALVAVQYPLWLGKGGWFRVWDMERQVATQQAQLSDVRTRNAALDAEVADLKSGTEAIEERARFELGMIRQHEIFVQLVDTSTVTLPTPIPPTPATQAKPPASGRPAPAPAQTPAR